MATTYPSHPKETPPAPKPETHDPTLVDGQPALKEGMEPTADTVPFHGGGFAKKGGAYPGGYVQPEEPPPPEGDTHASKTAKK